MLAGCEVVVEGLTNFSCGPFKFFIVVLSSRMNCGGGSCDETTDGSTT